MFYVYHTLAEVCIASVCLSGEVPLVRTMSLSTGTRVKAFSDAVRSRDNQCVISGRPVVCLNDIFYYDSFQAAHVFPLAYEQQWLHQDLSQWVTQQPERGGSINSVQNGLLLDNGIHQLFDNYSLSINLDVCMCDSCRAMGWLQSRMGIRSCVSIHLPCRGPVGSFHVCGLTTLYVLRISFCAGTSDRQFWLIWKVLVSRRLSTISRRDPISWETYERVRRQLSEWSMRYSVVWLCIWISVRLCVSQAWVK